MYQYLTINFAAGGRIIWGIQRRAAQGLKYDGYIVDGHLRSQHLTSNHIEWQYV